jgi:ABC-type uncharacterized transport system substrate-binding protein
MLIYSLVMADRERTGPGSQGIMNFETDCHQGMHELGYTKGQNLAIELRFVDWKLDRLHDLAAELVALKVDVIVAVATPAARAANKRPAPSRSSR